MLIRDLRLTYRHSGTALAVSGRGVSKESFDFLKKSRDGKDTRHFFEYFDKT